MSNKRLTLVRLEKQTYQLEKDPIPDVLVKRVGALNFHFCIYNLTDAYAGGFYHGVLQLHNDYPFAPPGLKFFTPSGRFQIDKLICTTFTNFHKQEWSSAWNVRKMIIATLSFMNSNQSGYGSINQSYHLKRRHAENSLAYNMNNQTFKELFAKEIKDKKLADLQIAMQKKQNINCAQNANFVNQPSKALNTLYILLGIFVIIYLLIKISG